MAKKKNKNVKKTNKNVKKTTKNVKEDVKKVEKKKEDTSVSTTKKKKKKHTGLKVLAILLTIFVVIPVAFVFGAFFDTSTKKVSNSEITYQNVVSKAIAKGFEGLTDPDDPRISLYIDPEMIDGVMISACDAINLKQFIPKMYCMVKDDNYTFAIDLQASFFKTRVLLGTTLKAVEGELDTQRTLEFNIKSLKIGRLPIPLNWVTGIAGNFIKDETINSAFEQAGFRIKCNFKKLQLTYDRVTFQEDVGKYLNKLGSENPFLDVLLTTLSDKDILHTDYNNGVHVDFKLSKLKLPDPESEAEYFKKAPIEFLDLEDHRKEVVDLLNNHGLEEGDVADTFKYLIRGYDNSTSEYIDRIKENNEVYRALEEYIPDESVEEYKGSTVKLTTTTKEARFKDYCESISTLDEICDIKIDSDKIKSLSFVLPSDKFNTILVQKLGTIVGTTIPITFKNDDQWCFEYVLVDNIYTGFQKPEGVNDPGDECQFVIYLRLNIGGVPLTLAIGTNTIKLGDCGTESIYLGFKLKNIYFGSIEIQNDELKNSILGLIPKEKVEWEKNDIFTYDQTEKQFKIHIKPLLSETVEEVLDHYIGNIPDFIKGITPTREVKEDDTFELKYSR